MTALGFLMLTGCASALWACEDKRMDYAHGLSNSGSAILVGAMAGYVVLLLGITVKLWEVMP